MAWLDLTIICLLLWGGVAGYFKGWKKTTGRLAAVITAAAAAVLFQGDLKTVISRHSPVDEAVKTVVYNRLAVPVGGAAAPYPVLLSTLDLPRAIHEPLLRVLSFTADLDFGFLVELLSRVILNALSFCAALALWWGFLCLIAFIWLERQKEGGARWMGALLGALRQALLVSLVLGTAVPITWLAGLPGEILCLEETVLARWSLEIFNMLGIWWR